MTVQQQEPLYAENVVEETQFGPIFVAHAEDHISVILTTSMDGHVHSLAAASADYMPDLGGWWIARVIVRHSERRRRGYGTCVLQRLLKQLKVATPVKQDGDKPIPIAIVAPGGYDTEPDVQRRFYVKNGFRYVPAEDFYRWDGSEQVV